MTEKNHPLIVVGCRLSVLVMLLALAGCIDDPYQRPGTWRLTYDNDANIAAMAANKHELIKGTDDPNSLAILSDRAMERLTTDKVKQLPSTEIGPVSGGGQSSSGGQ